MSDRRFKFSDIPEVEELQVLFMIIEWIQASTESSPNCETFTEKSDDLTSN